LKGERKMGEIQFTIPKSQLRKVAKAHSTEGEAVIELKPGYFTEDNQNVITAKTEKEAIRILRASRKEKVAKEDKTEADA
jgi:hypothetical protein